METDVNKLSKWDGDFQDAKEGKEWKSNVTRDLCKATYEQ